MKKNIFFEIFIIIQLIFAVLGAISCLTTLIIDGIGLFFFAFGMASIMLLNSVILITLSNMRRCEE